MEYNKLWNDFYSAKMSNVLVLQYLQITLVYYPELNDKDSWIKNIIN